MLLNGLQLWIGVITSYKLLLLVKKRRDMTRNDHNQGRMLALRFVLSHAPARLSTFLHVQGPFQGLDWIWLSHTAFITVVSVLVRYPIHASVLRWNVPTHVSAPIDGNTPPYALPVRSQ